VVVIMAAAEEEESAEEKAMNAGISVMLLGSVGFMMGLFYLVHQQDLDRQKYSWQVISSTISIFSAVLLFQGVNGVVETTLLDGASESIELLVGIVHMLVWFVVLQLLLAFISGAVACSSCLQFLFPEGEASKKLNLKCWAVLLGHITGFATINAFALLQQQVPRNLCSTFVVAPMAWLLVFLIGRVTNQVREAVALGDDGVEDISEKMWDEETEETEDDVVGLAVSFLVVQTVRFAVGGSLPNAEGQESAAAMEQHTGFQIMSLMGTGVVFAVLEVLRTVFIKRQFGRFTVQMRNIVAMCFAWCLFFSSEWLFSKECPYFEGMLKEVVIALFVTTVALIFIFFLDVIADLPETGKDVDKAIRAVVQALGILIGFSWEKAFDTAVEGVSESTEKYAPPSGTKLVMAIVLAGVVVPAWRMHILPTILAFEEEEEAEEEAEEEEKEGKKAKDAEIGGEALTKPLLDTAASKGAKVAPDYKKKFDDLKLRNASVEMRNAQLEGELCQIRNELKELHVIADQLRDSR